MITILNKSPDGLLYHQKINDTQKVARLNAGVYKIEWIDMGTHYLYGFRPQEATNDQPLEVDNQAISLVGEMDSFLKKGDIFKKFGFSHKRGYLLHGPPGCGKSTTIRLLQKHFTEKFDGVVLLWANSNESFEDHLNALKEFEPNRPVMVICEDIDSKLKHFESHILELLDGQKALDKFVLVATTNYLDVIPSRIKDRPSRIDRLVEIGNPDTKTRFKYLSNIGLDETQAAHIAANSEGLSIAKLKEVVIASVCFDEPVADVVKRLKGADMTMPANKADDDDWIANAAPKDPFDFLKSSNPLSPLEAKLLDEGGFTDDS